MNIVPSMFALLLCCKLFFADKYTAICVSERLLAKQSISWQELTEALEEETSSSVPALLSGDLTKSARHHATFTFGCCLLLVLDGEYVRASSYRL